MDYENMPDCNRLAARIHHDDRYVEIACTCGECHALEAATAFLDDLARQHHTQDEQARFDDLVCLYGYALPLPIWRHVDDEVRQWRADQAEAAERAAGWDPTP